MDGTLFVSGRADGHGCHFSTRPTHPSGAIRFNLQAIHWQPVSAELGVCWQVLLIGLPFPAHSSWQEMHVREATAREEGRPPALVRERCTPWEGHVGVQGLSSLGAERPLPPSDGSRPAGRRAGGSAVSWECSSSVDKQSILLYLSAGYHGHSPGSALRSRKSRLDTADERRCPQWPSHASPAQQPPPLPGSEINLRLREPLPGPTPCRPPNQKTPLASQRSTKQSGTFSGVKAASGVHAILVGKARSSSRS